MVHGILQSSFRFVLNGPEKAPAYQLADSDLFDVWLLNVRGNSFSREHSWLDADSSLEFWNFSFEEFGTSDIPTAIEHI
jgi:lysosomal acid lipase/cholesteryl ester hydrolase